MHERPLAPGLGLHPAPAAQGAEALFGADRPESGGERSPGQADGKAGLRETEALLDELAECLPGGDTPEEAYQAKELSAAVNRFLRRLPRREGDAFIRRYFFAETPREIGERYGMRENTVTVMLFRTRKKLRAYLKQEGYL